MKASLRFRRVRWIRAQRHRAKKEGDRQFVSPGENATCVRSKNHLEPYATLFLLYPHTAFAQTQKGTSINPTSTQTTSTDATDTPFRAGPEVPFPTLYRGTNPSKRFKRDSKASTAHISGESKPYQLTQ